MSSCPLEFISLFFYIVWSAAIYRGNILHSWHQIQHIVLVHFKINDVENATNHKNILTNGHETIILCQVLGPRSNLNSTRDQVLRILFQLYHKLFYSM